MKILIADNSPEFASMMVEFIIGSGHSIEVTPKALCSEVLKKEKFDLVVEDLDKFIKEEVRPSDETLEKAEQKIAKIIAEFLKHLRLKSDLSFAQLGNILAASRKSGDFEFDFPFEKKPAEIMLLFEGGEYCPPYNYLKVLTDICSGDRELEWILNFLETSFKSSNERSDRRYTIALLDLYYKKNAEKIEEIINSDNSNNSDNLLNFSHSKFKEG